MPKPDTKIAPKSAQFLGPQEFIAKLKIMRERKIEDVVLIDHIIQYVTKHPDSVKGFEAIASGMEI